LGLQNSSDLKIPSVLNWAGVGLLFFLCLPFLHPIQARSANKKNKNDFFASLFFDFLTIFFLS
jgi:hypothetical protein